MQLPYICYKKYPYTLAIVFDHYEKGRSGGHSTQFFLFNAMDFLNAFRTSSLSTRAFVIQFFSSMNAPSEIISLVSSYNLNPSKVAYALDHRSSRPLSKYSASWGGKRSVSSCIDSPYLAKIRRECVYLAASSFSLAPYLKYENAWLLEHKKSKAPKHLLIDFRKDVELLQ
jgi:hypothetical protein